MRDYAEIVALGSSFAAGPGIPPIEDRLAGRSTLNYAHLLARHLNAHLVDATVSGATTATILRDRQRVLWKRVAPQIDAVTATADLVTITAGGNDLGYLGSVISTALRNRLAAYTLARSTGRPLQPLNLPDREQLANATAGLTEIVDEARHRAPGARIVLVDYLPIVDAGTRPGPTVPFSPAEIDNFRGLADLLSSAYDRAGNETGAEVIRATDFAAGHGLGSAEPWVFGLGSIARLGCSFHPNAAGMRHVAGAIEKRLELTDS